jgi:tetratricopeptide (TPR) repeat protein
MFRFAVLTIVTGVLFAQTTQSPQDLLKEAVQAHQAGKLDEAIKDYRSLLELYPDMAMIRANLGAALASQGQYTEAIAEYKRALAAHSDTTVRLNLALAYYKISELSSAIGELITVRKEDPTNFQAVLLLGDCYLRTGDNKHVIDLVAPVQREKPDDAALNYMLGTALVRDGQTAQGQVVINQILKNGDSAEAHMLMGTTKIYVKDFAGARADLEKAVQLNPNLPDLYAYYGLSLLVTGDQDGANKAFTKALEQDPNNFDANLRLGVLLRQDQEYDQTMKYLTRALQVRPGDPGVLYQIATVEVAMGKTEEARTRLEQLVKDAPNFEEAHITLATVYYREKRKADGDREKLIAEKLSAARQAQQPAAKAEP